MLLCSDPIRAYLLDGECVKEWCHNALTREQSHLLQVTPCKCAARLILAYTNPNEASACLFKPQRRVDLNCGPPVAHCKCSHECLQYVH